MMKLAPEVFMWLHIERPAATNATLSPAQIAQKLTWLSSWHMPIYRVRIICCKFNTSVILFPPVCHWYYQSPSISLLFSTIAAFILVSYYGYTEVQPEQEDVESETSSPPVPDNTSVKHSIVVMGVVWVCGLC